MTADDRLLHEGMAALASALLHDEDTADEVVRAATGYSRRGEPLDLLLSDIDRCHLVIRGRVADPVTTRLAAATWACETNGHDVHVACVDPLTVSRRPSASRG